MTTGKEFRIFSSIMTTKRNIALVHDWLVGMRGGEKVLEVLCELFPEATLFTLVHRKGSCSPTIERMKIETSFLQHLPFGKSYYQHYLPLFPIAAQSLDVRDFDLVISSSHAAAKSVRVRKGVRHICYCHTPMRYIWDQYEQYFGKGRASFPVGLAMKMVRGYLQRWDVATAMNVDQFIANSENVRQRIQRIYERESTVIYPPVDVQKFSLSAKDDGYFLIVSALVPYKRIDIAVEAFNILGERLTIVGTGSEETRLKRMAKKNIEFVGWVKENDLQKYYSCCRALIFPGEEDFGIVPVEAMACGKPVIAFGKGGALETVVEGKTGMFFLEQRAESGEHGAKSLERRVREFGAMKFDAKSIREHAEQFSRERFCMEIERKINELGNRKPTSV